MSSILSRGIFPHVRPFRPKNFFQALVPPHKISGLFFWGLGSTVGRQRRFKSADVTIAVVYRHREHSVNRKIKTTFFHFPPNEIQVQRPVREEILLDNLPKRSCAGIGEFNQSLTRIPHSLRRTVETPSQKFPLVKNDNLVHRSGSSQKYPCLGSKRTLNFWPSSPYLFFAR